MLHGDLMSICLKVVDNMLGYGLPVHVLSDKKLLILVIVLLYVAPIQRYWVHSSSGVTSCLTNPVIVLHPLRHSRKVLQELTPTCQM